MGLFSKKERVIGLDIGEQSIKMVEIKKPSANNSKYELVNYANIPTPRGAVSGGQISNSQSVILAMQQVHNIFQGDTPKVATAISGDAVLVRNMVMPVMSDKELAEAVKFEVEAHIPIPTKEIVVDFMKVGDITENGVKKNEVMVVAARREVMNHYVEIIKSVGFEPGVIDIEPLALLRTVEITAGPESLKGCFAIVNIGAGITNISVFDNKVLRFTRSLAIAGNKLTNALISHYGISTEEAEGTKKLIDFSGSFDDKGLTVLLYQKAEIITPVISELVTEISRSLQFYMAGNRGKKIDIVYISGGTALLKGLTSNMSDELDLPVRVLDPIQHLKISAKLQHKEKEILEAGSSLAVVMGLAISEVN